MACRRCWGRSGAASCTRRTACRTSRRLFTCGCEQCNAARSGSHHHVVRWLAEGRTQTHMLFSSTTSPASIGKIVLVAVSSASRAGGSVGSFEVVEPAQRPRPSSSHRPAEGAHARGKCRARAQRTGSVACGRTEGNPAALVRSGSDLPVGSCQWHAGPAASSSNRHRTWARLQVEVEERGGDSGRKRQRQDSAG